MAIRVSNSTIIDNDYDINGLNGFDGNYDDLTSTAGGPNSSGNITFTSAFQNVVLDEDTFFFFQRESRGDSITLLLTTNGFDVTFDSSNSDSDKVYWTDAAEPVWNTSPKWLVTIICWAEDFFQASATPYT